MDFIYKAIDLIFPFAWTGHLFMKNALLAVLIFTPLFGIIGTMIVNNRMAFFSDSLGHSALTGIAIGVILGFKNPLISMLVFAVIFASGIAIIKNKTLSSTDTIIGVFTSTAVAVGVALLSSGGNFNKYTIYLIGDLLNITPSEIFLFLVVFIVVLILWFLFFNKLLIISINPELALSRGIKVYIYEIAFTILVAIVVVLSIQWVGILIINSMLILPAAASRNIAKNIRQYHFFSVLIALISGVTGLILSYYTRTILSVSSASIVIIASVFYFITLFVKLFRH
jgi:zinc transport system permease protein